MPAIPPCSPCRLATCPKSVQQVVRFAGTAVGTFRLGALPSVADLKCASKQDLSFLVQEIWKERSYLQGGVTLKLGDTVVDVGANIGLFTLQAAEEVGTEGKVIAVEPSPDAHQALLENLASYAAINSKAGQATAELAAVQAAAGSAYKEAIDLVTYTESSGWSTIYPDEQEVQEGMRMFLNNALPSMQGIEANLLSQGARLLRLLAPRPLYEALWRLYVDSMLAKKQVVQCQQRTLSDIIAEHDIQTIDLLKIDVERAELDVLAGLSQENWGSVRQLVMEVHDLHGRLQTVQKLLQQQGSFTSIQTVQPRQLQGSNLYNVYCT